MSHTNSKIALLIGRPILHDEQWFGDFITRSTDLQQRQQAREYQLQRYLEPPFLNRQAAQQLLPNLTSCRILFIFVSLLELGHHQVVSILEGVKILLETASVDRITHHFVEFENENPEHDDALELARIYHNETYLCSWTFSNTRSRFDHLLLNEGDKVVVEDGVPAEPEQDDQDELFGNNDLDSE